MPQVAVVPLPPGALLGRYSDDHYTDCFCVDLAGDVSFPAYVEAFYRTWLFKAERLILKWLVAKPSKDEQAGQLARGEIDSFAAWSVEARSANQLLLCDFRGTTRSWLMAAPADRDGAGKTRLYFGSAVISAVQGPGGRSEMGRSFRWLLGMHKLYSRALLHAASNKLGG